MNKSFYKNGYEELRQVRRQSRGLYWFTGIFSFFVNLLMLTGPLYMINRRRRPRGGIWVRSDPARPR